MGSIATAARHLIAAGVTGDALVTALEEIEDAGKPIRSKPIRSAAAERMVRYRARKKEAQESVTRASQSVTRDVPKEERTKEENIYTKTKNNTQDGRTESARARANGHHAVDDEFEREFWPNVPRKVAKPAALRAYRAARKRASAEVINDGIKRYSAERSGQDASFTVHPSTWLNQDRWADELALPRGPPADDKQEKARRFIAEHNAKHGKT